MTLVGVIGNAKCPKCGKEVKFKLLKANDGKTNYIERLCVCGYDFNAPNPVVFKNENPKPDVEKKPENIVHSKKKTKAKGKGK